MSKRYICCQKWSNVMSLATRRSTSFPFVTSSLTSNVKQEQFINYSVIVSVRKKKWCCDQNSMVYRVVPANQLRFQQQWSRDEEKQEFVNSSDNASLNAIHYLSRNSLWIFFLYFYRNLFAVSHRKFSGFARSFSQDLLSEFRLGFLWIVPGVSTRVTPRISAEGFHVRFCFQSFY